ncbi:RNA-processing protein [Methanocella sp. CWC-04]|uniref:RNA-processing protein n=1 Tax=Methanooceanicella nereidis TaxID=2052831 RepID=A0AAP2W567_9EURY|nr:NOP5/NOP56 family protein [Methanocella sp. CWC-04]MCD1293847.1 RNA-processing protein [Methanocella sp. CWC-04]
MKAWFGEFDADNIRKENIRLAGSDPGELARWAGVIGSKDTCTGIDFEEVSIMGGLCGSPTEYKRLMHETAMAVARERISLSLSGKDMYVAQAVKSLDDVNFSYNRLTERLAEWYGIHFPEFKARPQELIKAIMRGTRENSGDESSLTSMGAPMSPDDVAAIQGMASGAQRLFDERKSLEKYITESMEELAPNLSDVLGPLLGARFIARAGSLEKLSRMPASTIQVMGSGEALFKHLREGTPSPKHGLIYQHPLVSGSPKRIRGKVSRMLAAKAAIAARVDNYSGERLNLGQGLKEKVEAMKAKTPRRKK